MTTEFPDYRTRVLFCKEGIWPVKDQQLDEYEGRSDADQRCNIRRNLIDQQGQYG